MTFENAALRGKGVGLTQGSHDPFPAGLRKTDRVRFCGKLQGQKLGEIAHFLGIGGEVGIVGHFGFEGGGFFRAELVESPGGGADVGGV